MTTGRGTRIILAIVTLAILAFMYLPISLIFVYAFNDAPTAAWPPKGLTLHWFGVALANTALQQAFLTSIAGGARRDDHRPGPRDACRDGRRALPVLRSGDDLIHRHLSDRVAGHRDRVSR